MAVTASATCIRVHDPDLAFGFYCDGLSLDDRSKLRSSSAEVLQVRGAVRRPEHR